VVLLSGRIRGRVGEGEFELHGGQLAEVPLTASAVVVGVLDPLDDLIREFVPGPPVAAVEDVLLEQGIEGFHRCVVTCRGDSSHRAGEVVCLEHGSESSRTKWAAPVGVDHNNSLRLASCHR
jgi:hypothetical protein